MTGTIGSTSSTKPDPPGQPQLQATMMSRSVTLSWPVPPSNGAPILGYEVTWSGGRLACPSTPCTVPGLTNGDDYTFQVRAENKAGWSDFSRSVTTTQANRPNSQPLAVVATQTAAGDGTATLTWPSAQVRLGHHRLHPRLQRHHAGRGRALTATIAGLTNGPPIQVTLQARNNSTTGPTSTATVYAAGTPTITSMTIASPQTAQDAVAVVATFSGNLNGPAASGLTIAGSGARRATWRAAQLINGATPSAGRARMQMASTGRRTRIRSRPRPPSWESAGPDQPHPSPTHQGPPQSPGNHRGRGNRTKRHREDHFQRVQFPRRAGINNCGVTRNLLYLRAGGGRQQSRVLSPG
ncbi:MAG: fibronectin type III domain-containing protein, partial [Tetrasphaera sp.]|nr:fibronectin type III domain-containing protein [Tetrasphaera sp.]